MIDFETAIAKVETAVRYALDAGAQRHATSREILDAALAEAIGELDVEGQLAMLSTVRDIGDMEFADLGDFDPAVATTVGELVGGLVSRIVGARLSKVANAAAAACFVEAAVPAARGVIELAELCRGSEWISEELTDEMSAAVDRVEAGEPDERDMELLATCDRLIGAFLAAPTDTSAYERFGVSFEQLAQARKRMRAVSFDAFANRSEEDREEIDLAILEGFRTRRKAEVGSPSP
jgi:hypothetical protein